MDDTKTPPSSQASLINLLDQHLRSLAVKGFTHSTLHVRGVHLRMFIAWCANEGLAEPGQVTRSELERYQHHLFFYRKRDGEPLSFASQHVRLTPLRVWFKWMARQGIISNNPASELELPRLGYQLPPVLTQREAENILHQPNPSIRIGLRDRAMLEILYCTGIRRTELLRLALPEVDYQGGLLTIRQGKGRKDRVVPIGPRALAWLNRYIQQARPQLRGRSETEIIFLTTSGLSLTPNHLSALVKRYVWAAGIKKRGACHLFRHTMATLMLEGGADTRYIQQILGHVKLDTTQIYTHVSIRKLKEVHQATHPGVSLESDPGATVKITPEAERDVEIAGAPAAIDRQ